MKYRHALALYPHRTDSGNMALFPPTGLEYIATSMKGLVGEITLIDLRREPELHDLQRLSKLIDDGIDLICISVCWNSQFDEICDLITSLPPDIPTIVGGHKATEEVDLIFETCPNVDIIVRGEGEETIKDIVNGVPYPEILGISYRSGDSVLHNEVRPLPEIANIPFPDRSLRRQEYYWKHAGIKLMNLTFDTVLTTRGCPYKCKFCTFSLNPLGQKRMYTERPIASVIEELKCTTADVIMFSDDNFFTNPKRSEELCDQILQHGIEKKFIVQTRIEIAWHESLLKKAEQAGIQLFLVGIESPHDRILEQLHKGFDQKKIRAAFKILNGFKFYIHGYFIYGNIGETEEEMVYIAQFAKELKLDSISFQKLRIEKYSPLKELVENTPGYYYKGVGGSVYSEEFGRPELKRIRNRIRHDFYNPGQIIRICRKLLRTRLLSRSAFAWLLLRSPWILFRMVVRKPGKAARTQSSSGPRGVRSRRSARRTPQKTAAAG